MHGSIERVFDMSSPAYFSLLVVDDEPDLRTLYELTLLREGYDIETAGSVEEARLHLQDRVYSAVITDMRLPDGTGLDLLSYLESNARREKAIVITAYGSAENAVEALPDQAGRSETVSCGGRVSARQGAVDRAQYAALQLADRALAAVGPSDGGRSSRSFGR